MRVNRRFLYAGVFLIAVGGVLVAADLGAVDSPRLTDTLRLWPLAIIAVGLSLVLRGTRLSLPLGMLAVGVPGLVLGGALAIAPRFGVDCGAREAAPNVVTRQGVFEGGAIVSVTAGCGSIGVKTAPGNAWQLVAGNSEGHAPTIGSSARSLTIGQLDDEWWRFLEGGRETWDLTLPTSQIDNLSLTTTTSHGEVDLAGARIGRLGITANASDVVLDASTAEIAHLSAEVNVGSLAIQLPADSDLGGTLELGGGRLRLCSSPGVGLRVTTTGSPRQVTVAGLHQSASDWSSPDYVSAHRHTDLRIEAHFGNVEINPIGGCK